MYSKKTIAKFYAFVISTTALAIFFSACSDIASKETRPDTASHWGEPKVVGKIQSKEIDESSGIAVSRCQNDVMWTHNDSDEGPFIFAINSAGENLGTWKVTNANSNDWEDIAPYKDANGKCYVYIGDIGDNQKQFAEHAVYRVAEPVITASEAKSEQKNPLTTEPAEAVRFKYPNSTPNAETLLVHPTTGVIYVLTKHNQGPSSIYRIDPNFGSAEVQTAQKVGEISVPATPPGRLTGGDISPDGRRVFLCDNAQGYELTLPENTTNFDEIWTQKPEIVNMGERKQGESAGYNVDGSAVFATSEGKHSPVIEIKRR
jgi:hypothetical protein